MTPEPNQEEVVEEEEFDFTPEEATRPKERSWGETIDRKAARYTNRAIETIAGLPGDVVGLVKTLDSMMPEEPSWLKREPNFIQKAGKNLLESLPDSADFRAQTAERQPHLEPENEVEEIEDEWVGDIASLAIPVKGKIPFMRALGIASAGQAAKQGIKYAGGSEGAQELGKMGTMIFAGMFGKGRGVKKHIDRLYKEADSLVEQGAKVSMPTKKISTFESMISKGAMDDAKAPAFDIYQQMKNKISRGLMSVEDSIEFDKNINRQLRKVGGDKQKKYWLDQLKDVNQKGLDDYAKQNPSWGEVHKEAKQAYAGIAQSEDIKSFVKKNTNLKNIAHAGILLGLEESAIPGHMGVKMGAVGTTAAAYWTKEMAKRLAKNPALRKYYENVVRASINENKASLARNLAGLERVAKKDFEKDPLPTFNLDEEEEEE